MAVSIETRPRVHSMYAPCTLDVPHSPFRVCSVYLIPHTHRAFVATVQELAHCNPFLSERIELEHAPLGAAFDTHLADWNVRPKATTITRT